jgi:phosphoribosylaminoimidazole-succinocarboxamide synthase
VSGFGVAGAPPAPSIEGWSHLRTGKVRDLYANEAGEILLVASDRISAFDWVLPTTIPNKGAILTQLSLFWFELLADIVPNHIITDDVPDSVSDRAVIVQPLEMFAIECVARGYLTGSGLVEYNTQQAVCGNPLPAGLIRWFCATTQHFHPRDKS